MKYKLPVRTKIFLALFLITILTSFLQSHLDRISREERARQIEGGFMSTINKIGSFFKTIGKKLKNVAKGFEIVGNGLYAEIIGIGKTGELLVENTVKVATCVGQKINNYGFCSKYYFLDVMTDTIYSIFITLPLFTIKMFLGINLFSIESEMLGYAKGIDDIMSNSTGVRLSKYPENILDKCYRCTPELPSQKEQNKKIVGFLKKPIDDIGGGFKKVFSIFS
jgi:hypothetical protein